MSITFSELFVVDEVLPEYTACISIIIFNDLKRYVLGDMEEVVTKDCNWKQEKKDFKIPDDYTPDDNLTGTLFSGSIRHCLKPVYRSCVPSHLHPFDKGLIKKVFNAAKCPAKTNPSTVSGKISDCTSRIIKDRKRSQKSIAVG
ncbi:MAG: hypothetical protein LBK83_10950 [Treponema sp.]|jgi:hypothetical protein|nr:hypothetical protein [Treponema sp.]